MRTQYFTLLLLLPAPLGCAASREVAFKMHVINADSAFEAASVFDVNRDGKLDIFSGGFWYEAPHWTKQFVRDVPSADQYYLDFSNLPIDVDGDGWTDVITCAWHNKRLSWLRNPGPSAGPFQELKIDEPGNLETAILADVNGDGQPDVIPCLFNGRPAWYEFRRDASASGGAQWQKHLLPPQLEGAGIGAADLNADGRYDIVGGKGWAQQPAEPTADWSWHPEFDLQDAGIPIQLYDVDEDGDLDLIWGMGHDYGLYWLEQDRNPQGQRIWNRHDIDHTWSQAHLLLLGDLDGDGRKELVTGKRYRAHNGRDPGENEPRCLYYYRFDRATRNWRRHPIQENGPAGMGLSSQLADIDADGDLDIIAPGKSGLYLFENLLRR